VRALGLAEALPPLRCDEHVIGVVRRQYLDVCQGLCVGTGPAVSTGEALACRAVQRAQEQGPSQHFC
jgi:hypothetical protein